MNPLPAAPAPQAAQAAQATHLWRHARLATLAGARAGARAGDPAGDPAFGWIEDGAVLTRGAHIAWVGPDSEVPTGLRPDAEHDLHGALVTPGFVDAHTHLVYAGDRAAEWEQRLLGASYEDIARAGGGIRHTVAATEPCLVVVRRTQSRGVPITLARLVHPGMRYTIAGSFTP